MNQKHKLLFLVPNIHLGFSTNQINKTKIEKTTIKIVLFVRELKINGN